jgi:hypothetical protein
MMMIRGGLTPVQAKRTKRYSCEGDIHDPEETWEALMKVFRSVAKKEDDLPSTHRAGDAPVNNSNIMREGVTRFSTTQAPSEERVLALTLFLKCVVTALILSMLSYYFITRVELVSGVLYP